MGESYAYAVGNIRAREAQLLTRQELEGLLALRDPAMFKQALRDRGIGGEDSPGEERSVDDLLREETAALWRYLTGLVPDASLFRAFWYRNDYHNCKTVLKGTLAGRAYETMLLSPATVPFAVLIDAVSNRDFHRLPQPMQAAAARAYDVLAHSSDAPLADAILDRAAMSAMLEAARAAGSPLLRTYIDAMVFYTDLKIALRGARAEKSLLFLQEALCPCDALVFSRLAAAAVAGTDEVLALMEQTDVYGSREAAAAFRESPSAFEVYADNQLLKIARNSRLTALGPDPVIGYLIARENEIRELHILFSGLRAGQPEEDIRKRLRDVYV